MTKTEKALDFSLITPKNNLLYKRRLIYARDLLHELVIRDLKVRYKHSFLGVAWSLLNPLMQLLVFYIVFSFIVGLNIPNYLSYVFSGLLIWNWFQNSMSQAAYSITGNRDLISQPGFSISILPVVPLLTNLVHFILAQTIFIIYLWIKGTNPGQSILSLPLLMLLQGILTLGCAYFVAAANVIFRDTQHFLAVLLRLLFFLTPIFYNYSTLPENYQSLYRLNPMVLFVDTYREILIDTKHPDWLSLLPLWLVAIAILYFGYKAFMHIAYRFAEEL